MPTHINAQQTGHFAQFGWIEFEGFLSAGECEKIRAISRETIARRMKTEMKKLSRLDPTLLYRMGRDLWRESAYLQSLYCKEKLTTTFSSLTNKPLLQLACDQWIFPGKTFDPMHLNDHVSLQNLICGCLLILDGPQATNARFFSPERFPYVAEEQMLVAFGSPQTVYIHQPLDPSNQFLKQFGYSFGDHLRAEHHPICRNY